MASTYDICDILAEPDVDFHRLKYADWLDDGGIWGCHPPQPERAEFIRVQCELAMVPPDCLHTLAKKTTRQRGTEWDCDCRVCALRRRERELLSAGINGFLSAQTKGWPRGTEVRWHRGFVEVVIVSAADWLAHAAAILSQQPVREVELTTWPGEPHNQGLNWVLPPDWWKGNIGHSCTMNDPMERERMVQVSLNLNWPGLKFTLPPRILDTFDPAGGTDLASYEGGIPGWRAHLAGSFRISPLASDRVSG